MTRAADLVCQRPEGLYCPAGDFYIDPWRPVGRAVIAHAHGDHARPGHADYLAADDAREARPAVRFPRILRWRTDKPLHEVDTMLTLEALLAGAP